MVTVTMEMKVGVRRVFDVLADGWSYAGWVVGATHVREVDEGWPAVGTRIHHSVGPWPLVASDITTVLDVDPPHLLELQARLWPVGSARILLELSEVQPGRTTVRMSEQIDGGPGRILPQTVQSTLLVPRNRESLRRLAHLATGRAENPVQR